MCGHARWEPEMEVHGVAVIEVYGCVGGVDNAAIESYFESSARKRFESRSGRCELGRRDLAVIIRISLADLFDITPGECEVRNQAGPGEPYVRGAQSRVVSQRNNPPEKNEDGQKSESYRCVTDESVTHIVCHQFTGQCEVIVSNPQTPLRGYSQDSLQLHQHL